MMTRRILFVIGILVTAGLPLPCLAQRAQHGSVTAKGRAAAHLALIVEAKTKEGMLILEPGETLHSGDFFAIRVEVDRPAYMYVLGTNAQGQVAQLFPDAGHFLLQPGGAQRVPRLPDWIQLDQIKGQENLFVIASLEVLSNAQLMQRVKHTGSVTAKAPIAQHGTLAAQKSAAPPTLLTAVQYRSLGQAGVVRGMAIARGTVAQIGANQSALVHFSFQHQ